MKKSIFLTFVLAAGFAATFLTSSCGDDATSGCNTIVGRDTGSHVVWLGAVSSTTLGLSKIQDTLTASVSGSAVSIISTALQSTLTGSIDPSDCNKIILDSVFSGVNLPDTIKIPSATFGVVKIWDVRAGGSGTISSSGSNTEIKVVKGKTNISSPIDLTNLQGKSVSLKGSFLNIP